MLKNFLTFYLTLMARALLSLARDDDKLGKNFFDKVTKKYMSG